MTTCAVENGLGWGTPRLLVVGDMLVDRYICGEAERVSPEAPVLVLRQDECKVQPGGAANVATLLTCLNADVTILGVVGTDGEGDSLLQLLRDRHVDVADVAPEASRPTTCKTRFVGRTGPHQPHQVLRVDLESREPIGRDREAKLVAAALEQLDQYDAVIISDYAKGVCTELLVGKVIGAAKQQNIPVLVDPACDTDFRRYTGATLMTPNRIATEKWFGGKLTSADEILAATRSLRTALNLETSVITLDRDGLAFADRYTEELVPCRQRDVCDVTGAGDMVVAILGLCAASGISIQQSMRLANAAAGLEVERFGAEPVSSEEISAELSRCGGQQNKIVSIDELARELHRYRLQDRCIVFTNGCFDLLHFGHVSFLEEAANAGDLLIVAVNGDDSVRRLKGQSRPIISQDERARMLAAMDDVDFVVIFDEDTPNRLLEIIRPDVLVKGGTTGTIVGQEIVEGYGGTVMKLSVKDGWSTTGLIERMSAATVH